MDNTTPSLPLETENKSIWEELNEFFTELGDLIMEDFRNSAKFISSNRNYFATAAILAVLLQFSSIGNLGASFDKYCDKHLSGMQHGGGNDAVTFQQIQESKAAETRQKKADTKASNKIAKIDKKIDKATKGINDSNQKAAIAQDITQKAQDKKQKKMLESARKESVKAYEGKESERHEQDQEMKANKERLSFFEGIKKKMKSLSPGQMGGPVFGNLDVIFSSVKDIFYIVMIILTVAGVLSLPVLVFLIFTYMVFKVMISKFVVL